MTDNELLNMWLDEVIDSDGHYRAIFRKTAIWIYNIPEHKERVHIQFYSRDGAELEYPILWALGAWRKDTESWRMAKLREEREREARFIMDENVRRLMRRMVAKHFIDEAPARAASYQLLKSTALDNPIFSQYYRVKLVTNVNEI